MARLKSGRFAPGESGNPSGRPKQTPEQADAMEQIKALAQRQGSASAATRF